MYRSHLQALLHDFSASCAGCDQVHALLWPQLSGPSEKQVPAQRTAVHPVRSLSGIGHIAPPAQSALHSNAGKGVDPMICPSAQKRMPCATIIHTRQSLTLLQRTSLLAQSSQAQGSSRHDAEVWHLQGSDLRLLVPASGRQLSPMPRCCCQGSAIQSCTPRLTPSWRSWSLHTQPAQTQTIRTRLSQACSDLAQACRTETTIFYDKECRAASARLASNLLGTRYQLDLAPGVHKAFAREQALGNHSFLAGAAQLLPPFKP